MAELPSVRACYCHSWSVLLPAVGSNNLVAITERESRLGKPGQPPANGEGIEEDGTSIIINSVLLKIIQDSVQSRPSTLDIRGHLFDAPLEYIPETLGFVDSLTELYLADNQLLVLPDSLGSLKRLTVLDASCNQLMELPRSIGELTELKELDLHHNKLEELPVTLGQCVALERVSLEFNQLKALPQSIGQLKSLKTLKLHLNQISVLPFTMGQLSNLVDLDVHHNSLKSIPESIGRLQKLEKLNISANHFSLQVCFLLEPWEKPPLPLPLQLHFSLLKKEPFLAHGSIGGIARN